MGHHQISFSESRRPTGRRLDQPGYGDACPAKLLNDPSSVIETRRDIAHISCLYGREGYARIFQSLINSHSAQIFKGGPGMAAKRMKPYACDIDLCHLFFFVLSSDFDESRPDKRNFGLFSLVWIRKA
jgi:hypothetical protein